MKLVVGLGNPGVEYTNTRHNIGFQLLEFIAKEKIVDAGCTEYMYFDPETLVMYVHYTNINDKGLSEMHNSDGSLRTYNPKK